MKSIRRPLAPLLAAFVLAASTTTLAALVDAGPYVPTPHLIVERMLKLAGVGAKDHVIDLGSGDGRLAIAAVEKHKARSAAGVERQADLVKQATENAKKAGVGERVKFSAGDLFDADISQATVVTLYLLPEIMGEVQAKLQRDLKPGTRVVSHDYPLPTWKPAERIEFEVSEKVAISGTARTVLYLYRVPDKR